MSWSGSFSATASERCGPSSMPITIQFFDVASRPTRSWLRGLIGRRSQGSVDFFFAINQTIATGFWLISSLLVVLARNKAVVTFLAVR